MNPKLFALTGIAGTIFVAGAASAAYTGLEVAFVDPVAMGWDLAGYDESALDTWRVYATFDDTLGVITAVGDSAGLFELNSQSGTFFNSAAPGSGDFPSNSAFWSLTGFEDLQWDTYLTIGATSEAVPTTTGAPGFPTQAAGLTGSLTLNNTGWFVSGFPSQANAVDGRVLLGQFTIPNMTGMSGRNWRVSGLEVAGDSSSGFDLMENWTVVPGPAGIGLLALAGLAGRRRRSEQLRSTL